jgi:NAD-dependent SIR2 family protein deacetylase
VIKVVHTVDANTLRDTVQDANLNFLVGAGASAQLFRCLGDIEHLLATLDELSADDDASAVARASVYAEYFTEVLHKNIELLEHAMSADPLRASYQSFMRALNQILIRRRSTMLNRQVNIYTTNVDLAFEDTGEILGLNMNDGFSGRFLPRFSTTNFGAVTSRRSLQYENLSEVPTFNLYKLHGSVGWVAAADDTVITFEGSLAELRDVDAMLDAIRAELVPITNATSAATLLVDAALSFVDPAAARSFLEAYERLPVVNPRKTKFQQTVMNQNYYDLLRIFTNELEKENSVLFLIGFSCRDEHIRELLLRACRSNPTLQVYVFAHEYANIADFESVFAGQAIPNSNLQIVAPEQEADPDKVDRFSLGRITEKFLAPIAPTPTVPLPVAPGGTSA